jgi:asparagine N-glycosylation enzyme membrane subunit Stt3
MLKRSVLLDIVLFIVIIFLLLWIVPLISSLLKQLFVLQVVIVIAGAIGLRFLVEKIRRKIE